MAKGTQIVVLGVWSKCICINPLGHYKKRETKALQGMQQSILLPPITCIAVQVTSKCATNIENCSNSTSYLITNTQVSIRLLSECYVFHSQIPHPAYSSFPPIFTEPLFQFPIHKYNNYNKIETMWTLKSQDVGSLDIALVMTDNRLYLSLSPAHVVSTTILGILYNFFPLSIGEWVCTWYNGPKFVHSSVKTWMDWG